MTTTAKLTLEQFLAMPETKPASEYVDGEVIQKPMPDQKHSLLQAFLARILDEFLEMSGLGVVGSEWRCIFGPPGQPADEFADKILFYMMHGVRMAWVLNPERLIITVYVPGREPRHLTVEETLDGGDVLPGFSVPVERIFARIRDL